MKNQIRFLPVEQREQISACPERRRERRTASTVFSVISTKQAQSTVDKALNHTENLLFQHRAHTNHGLPLSCSEYSDVNLKQTGSLPEQEKTRPS